MATAGIMTFADELEQAEVPALDFQQTIHEAVRLAESGCWDVKLNCPDGRRRTVKQIVRQFRLERVLCFEAA